MTSLRRFARPAVVSALVAGLAVPLAPGAAVAAVGTPSTTGCAAGFKLLSLAFLTSQGPYELPFALDAMGNKDLFVCGRPIQAAAAEQACGGPCDVPVLYNFFDNDLTPAH